MQITPREALSMGLVDKRKPVPKHGEIVHTDQLFDASRIFDHEDIARDVALQHHRFITESGNNYLAIERALTDANQQLQHLTYDCNIAAWGYHDWKVVNAPNKAQLANVPQMMEDAYQFHPNWERKAQRAHVLRTFAAQLSEGLRVAQHKAVQCMNGIADDDHEKELRVAFEAHESVEREMRYQTWRHANR